MRSDAPEAENFAVLMAPSTLQMPLMPKHADERAALVFVDAEVAREDVGAVLHELQPRTVSSSSMHISASMFRTLCTHVTCLSPMPSMRCAPKPAL
jgi:hypothetical protein